MKKLIYYIKKAYHEKFAIGQFNFSTFEQMKGIVRAAENLKSPVILGTSEGESKFFGLAEAVALRDALRKKTGLPIFLNLDHGKSLEHVKKAILAGYDMVCFDGSQLPLKENIEITKKVVALAQKHGAVVEGEVGQFRYSASKVYSEKFEIQEEDLTDPADAQLYVEQTNVDALAVSVGNFHGIDVNVVSPHLKLDRLKEIEEKIKTPLVLHGGSGTPTEDLKKSIQLGIVKININTDVRLAFSHVLRQSLQTNKESIVPYQYLPESIKAVQKTVEEKIRLFDSVDKI